MREYLSVTCTPQFFASTVPPFVADIVATLQSSPLSTRTLNTFTFRLIKCQFWLGSNAGVVHLKRLVDLVKLNGIELD